MSYFKSLSKQLQSSIKSSGVPIQLGNVHQLLATSLGYGTAAAYRTSTEEIPGVSPDCHVLVDMDGLGVRVAKGTYSQADADLFLAHLIRVCGGAGAFPNLHINWGSFDDFVEDFVTESLLADTSLFFDSDEFASALAETNGTTLDDDFTVEILTPNVALRNAVGHWDVPFVAIVPLEQREDRPWSGSQIEGHGYVRFQKYGRTCIANPEIAIDCIDRDKNHLGNQDDIADEVAFVTEGPSNV